MSTALSSTESGTSSPRLTRSQRALRAVSDVGPLLRFRASGVRDRSRSAVKLGLGFILTVTLLVAWLG